MFAVPEIEQALNEYVEEFVPAMLRRQYHLILVKGGPDHPHLPEQSHFAHIVNGVFGLSQLVAFLIERGARLPGLNEKTFRYKRMLEGAISSVRIHSEPGLPLYPAGNELCRIAHRYCAEGNHEIEEKNLADGLAFLSYAYGWIDAGVRMSILKVEKNRELFTV